MPVAIMLVSLVTIVFMAGGSSISDYSPAVLLMSATVALVLSWLSRTWSVERLKEGLRRSAGQILPAVILLLLIALVSTTWLLSGVVPTLVDYGLKMLNPTFFLVTACAVCAVVSVLTGSSWTTIATIGVAFIGIGRVMGYDDAWIAGAIISGAYFGDKVSPLSDTTVLASSSCDVDLFDHIRFMMYTTVPAMTIALLVFLGVGLYVSPEPAVSSAEFVNALHSTFVITPFALVIPLIVVVLIVCRVKTVITLAVGAALGVAGIFLFQPGMINAIAGSDVSGVAEHARIILGALWSETALQTGSATLDEFATTGGLMGMLPTVCLVLCAMIFGAAMIGTGMLKTIATTFTRHLRKRHSIVGATVGSGLFLNSCTADQYLSIIIGGNMYRDVYKRYSLDSRLLSRTLEDSVSVTSVLIPWNSCGVTQSAVLGVATLTYLPCCVFNILSPVMTLILARVGYKIPAPAIAEEASV